MKNGKVYFAHGKESGPWGKKINALAVIARELDFGVESPDYQFSQNPVARAQYFLDLNPQATHGKLVLVGSSMGGYVSGMAADTLRPLGLFLMAPAFFVDGYPDEPKWLPKNTEIVHGWHDDVIPVESSIKLAQKHQSTLHVINSEHTLNEAIEEIEVLFRQFLLNVIYS